MVYHFFFFLLRYELAGIRAFNFVLKNSLGGGGVSSIRLDPQVSYNHTLLYQCSCIIVTIKNVQGKAYGQMLGDLELNNLPSLEDMENDYKMNTYAELS